jgi:hypothetical protein
MNRIPRTPSLVNLVTDYHENEMMSGLPRFYNPRNCETFYNGRDIPNGVGGNMKIPQNYIEKRNDWYENTEYPYGSKGNKNILPGALFRHQEVISIAREIGAQLVTKTSENTYYLKCSKYRSNAETSETIAEKLVGHYTPSSKRVSYSMRKSWIIHY